MKDMVYIGKIVKPQGIKGEVKVKPADSNLKRYKDIKHLFLDNKETSVLSISMRQGFLYIKLEGVVDRNASELLRNKKLYAKREELETLKENEFYYEDLIGCIVVDEENKLIGELIDIEQYGASDIFDIRQNNKVFMVPFLDSVVKHVDTENMKIIVDRKTYNEVRICE